MSEAPPKDQITAIVWRSGLDQFGEAISEQALKSAIPTFKRKLPQKLIPDFRFDGSPLGEVVDLYWSEDDKAVYATVELSPATRDKFPNFPFDESLRPAFATDTSHKSHNTGYLIRTGIRVMAISVCLGIHPARLPDPYVLYL